MLNPAGKFKFSTGTDEHGSKIQQAAFKNKSNLSDYCTRVSKRYKTLTEQFSIDYSDFIRTTDEDHQKSVHKLWVCWFLIFYVEKRL
jgi:methionyl-tRNA synthetase